MKISKPESIFKKVETKFNSLPDIQQTVVCGIAAAIIVTITFAIQSLLPNTPTKAFHFPSEQEIKADNIASIKETMDEIYIKRMPNDIGSELAIGYKEMAFKSLSKRNNTYSKELCESYNSVAFCAELKAEFAAKINVMADRAILEANIDREYELKKLEN